MFVGDYRPSAQTTRNHILEPQQNPLPPVSEGMTSYMLIRVGNTVFPPGWGGGSLISQNQAI